MPEHKKQARDLAITAAKDKARQLAEGTGARLGAIRTLSEGTTSGWSHQAAYGNVVQTELTESDDASDVIAPGTRPLTLTIQATFARE
jgi:uncharacterized protein YggE